jgi:hypothetical protein
MVEPDGKKSNTSVIDELAKWGAIIENIRGFSDGCEAFKK